MHAWDSNTASQRKCRGPWSNQRIPSCLCTDLCRTCCFVRVWLLFAKRRPYGDRYTVVYWNKIYTFILNCIYDVFDTYEYYVRKMVYYIIYTSFFNQYKYIYVFTFVSIGYLESWSYRLFFQFKLLWTECHRMWLEGTKQNLCTCQWGLLVGQPSFLSAWSLWLPIVWGPYIALDGFCSNILPLQEENNACDDGAVALRTGWCVYNHGWTKVWLLSILNWQILQSPDRCLLFSYVPGQGDVGEDCQIQEH